MKHIIRNYVLRQIDKATGTGDSGKYETIVFSPSVGGQVLFENILTEIPEEHSKTELYVNGVSHNVDIDYKIINHISLQWLNPLTLTTDDVLTFVFH